MLAVGSIVTGEGGADVVGDRVQVVPFRRSDDRFGEVRRHVQIGERELDDGRQFTIAAGRLETLQVQHEVFRKFLKRSEEIAGAKFFLKPQCFFA